MTKKWIGFIIALLITGVVIVGCYDVPGYNPVGPVPEEPGAPVAINYSEADVDAIVTVEAETIAPFRDLSAYGVDESQIPDKYDCNNITFIRYRLNTETLGLTENPATAEYTDMGFIMVPGIYEGANGFEYIARHMVYKAFVNRGKKIEVWAVDRRNNCIEDRVGADAVEDKYDAVIDPGSDGGTSITQAEEEAMVDMAVGYYYGNDEIDGNTFDGWYSSKDVPYLSEFGLQMDTEDMYQIIRTMVPNQADRKSKVFVGGHSLGGVHTGIFASWDFDGNPFTLEDAGFNNTAGLFCFDSVVTPVDKAVNLVIKEFIPVLNDYIIGFGENLTWPIYEIAIQGLRSGMIPRIAEGIISELAVNSPIGPEMMTLIEVVGALAYALPDKEHTAVREIYPLMGDDVRNTVQKYVSRNQKMYDDGWPTILDFRFTNEALLGLFFDDDYTHIGMIQISMGFLYSDEGGGVAPKMDIGEGLFVPINAGPYECDDQGCEITGQAPLYKWANFDEVARDGDDYTDIDGLLTYTTYKNECSDILSLGRSMFRGESNLVEWYFGLRRIVDMLAAVASWGPLYGMNTWHQYKALNDMPVIEFLAEEGVITDNILQKSLPVNPVLIEGTNHMDMMWASSNTNYRDDDNVIEMLLDWAEDSM